jgi:type II secretory pathway pseudopilin PulG
MTDGTRAANAGFSLLEILIAFTIATTSLGLLFRIHANSTATVVLSEEYQEATALAQALIAEHSVTERGVAFTKTGSTDKYEWVVRGSAHSGAAGDSPAQRPPYVLRAIAAEVRWTGRDRDRRIAVKTVKPFFEPEP